MEIHLSSVILLTIWILSAYSVAASQINCSNENGAPQSDELPNEVYWSEDLESRFQPIFSEEQRKSFVTKARTMRVMSLQGEACGRMKNRLAVLEDGTKVCCRYRDNVNELRGELYAYHFSNLLGLWSIPPTTAVRVDFGSRQWRNVAKSAQDAEWEDGSDVIMVLYVENLEGEYVPDILKQDNPILTQKSVQNLAIKEQLRLMQWSDMIVFDFITGHTDRLFNNLLNLQWNPHMMEKFVHNLHRTSSGHLVLIDNESAFWIGYVSAKKKPANYDLQLLFLQKLCIFRRSTLRTVQCLQDSGQGDVILAKYVERTDPESYVSMQKFNRRDKEHFLSRIQTVMEVAQQCITAL